MSLPKPDSGSICLVTGASSGIGAEIARELAALGHGLALVARREDRLTELADDLSDSFGVPAETLGYDIGEAKGREGLYGALEELGLEVALLVNNAGFGTTGRFHQLDPEREAEMVRTNVEAVVALCGRYVPRMVERGSGGVLNVASIAAFQPLPGQATYSASKAFVLQFTEALHADLAGTGVVATALCPGPVETEFAEVAGAGDAAEGSPSFFWMSADEVASAGVRGLSEGKRVVVPGRVNQAAALSGQHVPRSLLFTVARRFNPFT